MQRLWWADLPLVPSSNKEGKPEGARGGFFRILSREGSAKRLMGFWLQTSSSPSMKMEGRLESFSLYLFGGGLGV